MWEVDPMNPNESILEHLGMTGEEYREKCREGAIKAYWDNYEKEFCSAYKLPPSFLKIDLGLDDAGQKRVYDLFNQMYIEPMKVLISEQLQKEIDRRRIQRDELVKSAKAFYDARPDVPVCKELQAAFDRLAPETQSTDEEEIIWPI